MSTTEGTSAVRTGAVGAASVPVFAVIDWVLGLMFPNHPVPPDVKLALAAGVLSVSHAVFNKWLRPQGEPPIPLSQLPQ